MAKLISFKSFLQTGVLGPIRLGLTLRQVAQLMGTPGTWIDNGTLPFPNYWGYGCLEINFSWPQGGVKADQPDMQPVVDWFQIEAGGSLTGDSEIIKTGGGIALQFSEGAHSYSNDFGDALILTLDGLSGTSRPAEFLVALMTDCPDLSVRIDRTRGAEYYGVHILNGPINMIFNFWDDEDDEDVKLARTDAEVAHLVQAAKLDSIYSYSDPGLYDAPHSATERRRFSAAAFLAAVRAKSN